MKNLIEIFFSYAHEDEELMNDVRRQLIVEERNGRILKWHDRKIPPGTEWQRQIDSRLQRARIILLFMSPHFIESRYCYEVEGQVALNRHEIGDARVIPVILRPCLWERSPFGKLQALPRDAKPISRRQDRDEACMNVAEGVMAVVDELLLSPNPAQKTEYSHTPTIFRKFAYHLDELMKDKKLSGLGIIFLNKIKTAPPFLGIDHSKYILSPELERVFTEHFSAKDFKKANEGIIRGGISYIGKHGDTRHTVAKKIYGSLKFASKIPYSSFANGSRYRLPPVDTDESRGLSSEEIAKIYSKADEGYIEQAKKAMVNQFNLPEDEVLWLMETIYRAAQISKPA